MTAIPPDPDDPGEASQLTGLAHLMQLSEDLVSARDTVVLPVVAPNALGMCAADPVSSRLAPLPKCWRQLLLCVRNYAAADPLSGGTQLHDGAPEVQVSATSWEPRVAGSNPVVPV